MDIEIYIFNIYSINFVVNVETLDIFTITKNDINDLIDGHILTNDNLTVMDLILEHPYSLSSSIYTV